MAKQTKSVWQFHDNKDELQELFEYSRWVKNEVLREAFDKDFTSRSSYHNEFYHKLKSDFHAKHTANAIFYAASKLKLYKKTKEKPNAEAIHEKSRNHNKC